MSAAQPLFSKAWAALQRIVAVLLLLAVLSGAVFGIWMMVTSLAPEVSAAIIAAAVTVLVSVFSLVYTKRWERRSVIEQEHRKQKAQAYGKFMALLFVTMRSGQAGSPPPPNKVAHDFDEFARELLIWGSDNVIKKFAAFRTFADTSEPLSASPGATPAQKAETERRALQALVAFEEVLCAIRLDLGHDNDDLKPGDLLRTFVNGLNLSEPRQTTPPAN